MLALVCCNIHVQSTNKQIAKDKGWLREPSSLASALTESSDRGGFLLWGVSSGNSQLTPRIFGHPGFHKHFSSFSQPPCRKPYCWTLRKQGISVLSGCLSGHGEGQGSLLGGHLWKVNYPVCSVEKYLVYLLQQTAAPWKDLQRLLIPEKTEQVKASVGEQYFKTYDTFNKPGDSADRKCLVTLLIGNFSGPCPECSLTRIMVF